MSGLWKVLGSRSPDTLGRRLIKKSDVSETSDFCLAMSRVDFSSLDGDMQVILLWREGAGGKLRERTRRTVGFVKVHEYVSIFMCVGIVITP